MRSQSAPASTRWATSTSPSSKETLLAIINNDNIEHVNQAIRSAARSECAKWGMDDWEDIAQTVFEKVWKYDLNGDFDKLSHDSEDFYKSIKRYSKKTINNERVDYMHFSGAYLYPRPAVVHILENLAWGEPGTIDETESKVDVRRSYDRMSENYRLALYKRYALGIVSNDGGERKQCTRALDALTNHLNFTTSPGPLSVEQLAENE